jgi:hypothetical protein
LFRARNYRFFLQSGENRGVPKKLVERLHENLGPNEREEIEGFIAQIDTALNLLGESGESSDS